MSTIKEPVVICVDAKWGEGKTTFLRMWQQHLKLEGYPTIFYNAWENDFTDDALVSLLGEIGAALKELEGDASLFKTLRESNLLKSAGKKALNITIKLASQGLVEGDVGKAVAGLLTATVSEEIENYEKSKKSLKEFRERLGEVAKSFSEENKPLIFFIDELDRCRPTFSIEILEKAKHFFNVKHIIFVLGADKEQLGHSIKAVYGEGINAEGYLRKFIDFDYLLPQPATDKYINALFRKFSFSTRLPKEYLAFFFHTMNVLFDHYELTLREQEHCCSLLSLALRTGRSHFPAMLCFLIVIKINLNSSPKCNTLIAEWKS